MFQLLTLIWVWVGFLGVRFELGGGGQGGITLSTPVSIFFLCQKSAFFGENKF